VTGHERQTAPSRELILENHRFPGEYIVKAFGPGSKAFREQVRACAVEVMGERRVVTSERATRSGHKICVTLTLEANTVEEVERVYDRVCEVPGLMFLL
jgi:putative lipoic acid-binding regulatory protein